uniref:Choline transporter-like protein n=1 Tax=Chenopodium quinoa TaxID=63459 RepID=A0A803MHC0_CHEQI
MYPSSDGGQLGGVIQKNRKCRDIVFLVIFVVFWIAMIVNSSFGFNKGNPKRLVYGLDYEGNLCGDKDAHRNLRELELRYWVNPNQVHESGLKNSAFKLADARSICLLDCPIPAEDSLNWVCDYPDGDIHLTLDEWIDRNYDYFEFLTPDMRNSSLQLQGPCYPVIYPSVNVFWSCQFIARPSNMSLRHWQQMGGVNINEGLEIDKSIHKTMNSRSAVVKRYMADIGKSWFVLLVCGGVLPLFLSGIWLLLIRYLVSGMPWITVVLFNILVVSVTMLFYLKAGWIGNDAVTPIVGVHDPYDHVYGRVAAKVIREVRFLMTFPVIPYAILGIFYMIWVSAALHIFSSGEVHQNNCESNCCAYNLGSSRVSCERCCGYSIHYTPHIGVSILFHLFGGYWATHFFIACSSTVIAGSVASYYWARGDSSSRIPFLPVFASMKRLVRYNLGSVAIGSLVLSFVESIRFILEAIRRKLKVSYTTPDNWFGKIAITGKSFFKSSAIATELIMNNILRIGKVNVVGDVILSLGKFCVSLSSAMFAFLMLDTYDYKSAHKKITSPLFPVLACWVLGYVVATLFFGVVEMSIDSIILSFCQDAEENQGTAQYAPPLLLETLTDKNETQRLTN